MISLSVVLRDFLPLIRLWKSCFVVSFLLWQMWWTLFKFGVHALLTPEKRSILLKPSFFQRGFIDFSPFPPDLIVAAMCVLINNVYWRVSGMTVVILCCWWRWCSVLRTRILRSLHLFRAALYSFFSANSGRSNRLSLGLLQSWVLWGYFPHIFLPISVLFWNTSWFFFFILNLSVKNIHWCYQKR